MSLGNSLDMDAMLRESLPTYLRKLNCLAGLVVHARHEPDGSVRPEVRHAIPRRLNDNPAVRSVRAILAEPSTSREWQEFAASLPLFGRVGDMAYHIMDLPEFGAIVLIKSGEAFDAPVLLSLQDINVKLARACVSCLQAEHTEAMNQALQHEIEQRKKAQENFRRIFEEALEGIFQGRPDGSPINVNPAMARIFGYDDPDHFLREMRSFKTRYLHQSDRNRFVALLREKRAVAGFEVEMLRRDNTPIWVAISARIVEEPEDENFVEGIVDDITLRKQAEQELRQAKEEAEKLNRLKTDFLSTVSHELRTPLTSILGFTKILGRHFKKATCPSECKFSGLPVNRIASNLDIIETEGRRLTELINNVLDLTRLEADRFDWHMGEVDMNNVVEHAVEATRVLFEEKGLKLELHADRLPEVSGDRDRLIQVCVNLLSNAVKFTPEGEVTVTARAGEGEILVEIRDTGIGVPPEETEIIFDKFRQLGDTLTEKPRGSGLGLPICKEIVEHHGGRMNVRPAPDRGSVFWFSLPVRKAGEPNPADPYQARNL